MILICKWTSTDHIPPNGDTYQSRNVTTGKAVVVSPGAPGLSRTGEFTRSGLLEMSVLKIHRETRLQPRRAHLAMGRRYPYLPRTCGEPQVPTRRSDLS